MRRLNMCVQFAAALVLIGMMLSGCTVNSRPVGAGAAGEEVGVSVRETVTVADPQAAVDEVYAALPDARAEPLTSRLMGEHFADIEDQVKAFYGCVSDPGGTLSDLIILQPAEGGRDAVRDGLLAYQEKRIREFENYDILGAFDIANNASVIIQGDYVILLMLGDNEAAQDIIDKHIPL